MKEGKKRHSFIIIFLSYIAFRVLQVFLLHHTKIAKSCDHAHTVTHTHTHLQTQYKENNFVNINSAYCHIHKEIIAIYLTGKIAIYQKETILLYKVVNFFPYSLRFRNLLNRLSFLFVDASFRFLDVFRLFLHSLSLQIQST